MPFLEQSALYNAINFTTKTSDVSNSTAVSQSIKVFLCPSEPYPMPATTVSSTAASSTYGVSNYGWCEGTWYTYGGFGNRTPNPAAFGANTSRTFGAFTDGLSNTLLAAEVKAYTPAYHDSVTVPAPLAGSTPTTYPAVSDVLASVAAAPTSGGKVATAPAGTPGGGHTHWANGNSFYDGFTTALPPNTKSPLNGVAADGDMTSEDEDDGGPNYAAITSRSYHPGGVNALFGDGSVRFIKGTVNVQTWRALGTIGGGEVRLLRTPIESRPGGGGRRDARLPSRPSPDSARGDGDHRPL